MAKSTKKSSRRKGSTGVGYGSPPVQHRFPPGTSGNPRGRPKRLPDLTELTAKELRRRGSMIIDGKRVSVSRIELLVKQIISNAGKGNPKALGFLMERLGKIDAKERQRALLSQGTTIHKGMTAKEAADEYATWFKEVCSQEMLDE
jgi:hypothetical protein